MDSDTEAVRPWIESANPTYVTLIDQNHVLSSLYNMVNVPQAVWIDENGIVVRPTETAGSIDILRDFDPAIGGFPPETLEKAGEAKNTYVGAVKDWAIKGSASRYVFDAVAARAHVPAMTDDMALAHATFQLGQYLYREGRTEEAEALFARCRELHPASWNIFRQTTEKEETGIAVGEEFWGKVMSLADEQYYPSVDMEGMPD
jgi:hypothetical protein